MKIIRRNSIRAWILAARPKTLAGAITPVMKGILGETSRNILLFGLSLSVGFIIS